VTVAGDLAKYELDLVGAQEVEDGTGVALNQQEIMYFLCSWRFQWLQDPSPIIWDNLNNEKREPVDISGGGWGRIPKTQMYLKQTEE
jgi:hypothetical protein